MGRKKMVGTSAEKGEVRMRLDPQFHQRVQEEAQRLQMTVAAFCRTAVVKEMQRIEAAKAKGEPT